MPTPTRLPTPVLVIASLVLGLLVVGGILLVGSVGVPEATPMPSSTATLVAPTPSPTDPRATPEGAVRAFFAALADDAPRPLCIQDAPAATGVTLGEDLLVDLAAHERVAALKLESPDAVVRIGSIGGRVGDGATLLGGSGGLELLAELRSGSAGTMPGAGHAAVFVRIWEAVRAGDEHAAETLFGLLQPILVLASRSGDTFLAVQKELLVRAGLLRNAALRQPSEPLAERVRAELERLESRLAMATVRLTA